jgi:Carboxypeptidase regulatory-like domain
LKPQRRDCQKPSGQIGEAINGSSVLIQTDPSGPKSKDNGRWLRYDWPAQLKGKVTMVSSGRQTTVCILLLLSTYISVPSQSTIDKPVNSTISGKVTVGGKGVWGIVVGLVISDQYRSNFQPTRFRSTTDEGGNYRITNVPPGTYEVIPASPSYVATEGRKSLVVGKNETVENIDISLERGGVITGKVSDADGRPVVEEEVSVLAATTTHRAFYFRNIRTDDRGIYRAYGVPPGSYRVSAGRDASVGRERQRTYHPGALDPAAAILVDVREGSEAINVDITFGRPARTYSAHGRIIDSDTTQPVPKMPVGVQTFWEHGSTAMGGVAESTKDGEFKVENLLPGKYAVYSEPSADSNWHSEAVQFEVTDRDVEGLLIKTFRGASASGVVILEGTDDTKLRASLLAGRIVGQILDGYLGRSEPSAAINPDGSFRITGLAAGRLVLRPQPGERFQLIRLERDGMVYPRGVEIKEHEQVTGLRVVVGHANGAISGMIRVANGMELPATARLAVVVTRTEEIVPYGRPVEADLRGQFRIEGLIPGRYEIDVTVFMDAPSAQSASIPPARQTVVVTNGAVADVTITLQIPKPAVTRP